MTTACPTHSYGLYSYGLYRHGLYSYGLYSHGLPHAHRMPDARMNMRMDMPTDMRVDTLARRHLRESRECVHTCA